MIAMLLDFKDSKYVVAEVLRAQFEFWHGAALLAVGLVLIGHSVGFVTQT